MRLFVIISLASLLAVASSSRPVSAKRRRESKWDIIHHEYHGPPAPLAKDGRVIDTPEVAQARANHLAIREETVAELARLMAEANALDSKLEKEESSPAAEEPSAPAAEAPASEAQPESAPIVAAPVEVTPELMATLVAAAEEPKPEKKEEEEEAPKAEPEQKQPEAAPEAEQQQQQPAAEDVPESPAAEPAKPEEKPVVEAVSEAVNEVDADRPVYVSQRNYEGPLAPLGEDGRVVDTIEVRKAKEAHILAYEQAVKLAKAKREEAGAESSPAWYEQRKKVYVPPVYLLYHPDGPVGYNGPRAPLGGDGRVVDTKDVERAKAEHLKALERAEAIAKRNPPKPKDNKL